MRHERQQSPRTNKPAQHAPHPRNHASPSPTAAQDPCFQTLTGCWRAHTGLHSQLATSSHRSRVRRLGTTSRRRDGPSPGQSRPPSPLQPPSPQCMVRTGSAVPTDALRSPLTAGLPCISAPEAPQIWHPTRIATADSVDLHQTHQASQTANYHNGAMRRDAEGSATPVRANPAATQQQKPKPFRVTSGVRPAGVRVLVGTTQGRRT
jgi:hypothetical protein